MTIQWRPLSKTDVAAMTALVNTVIELVGTRREARRRGLARAVLLGSLRAAREVSIDVAELEVDSTSPTGADRLYTSVGFAPVRTISRYQRDL